VFHVIKQHAQNRHNSLYSCLKICHIEKEKGGELALFFSKGQNYDQLAKFKRGQTVDKYK
jgi:hypothetical protein